MGLGITLILGVILAWIGFALYIRRPLQRRAQRFVSEPRESPIKKMHPEVASGLWAFLGAFVIVFSLLYAAFDKDFLIQVPTAKFWAPVAAIGGSFFIYRFLGAAGKYFGAFVVGALFIFIVAVSVKSARATKQMAKAHDDSLASAAVQQLLDSVRMAQQLQPIPEAPATPTPQSTPAADVGLAEYARRISDERERIAKDSAKAAALDEARRDLNMRVANESLNGWEVPADLRQDVLKQRVTLVCTRKGIALAAQLGKRLGALGAIISYEVRDTLDAPSNGQLRYSSANYRASTAIQAALIDLIRLDLVNQPGLSQVVLLLNVEQ